ncbi:hypothetical protein, partial [Nocardia lijiangensis]|uniref:hypothetical protein n=1 Tax=Nocardia lijiangensis TaxID=299618 RepID=UPI003D71D0DA
MDAMLSLLEEVIVTIRLVQSTQAIPPLIGTYAVLTAASNRATTIVLLELGLTPATAATRSTCTYDRPREESINIGSAAMRMRGARRRLLLIHIGNRRTSVSAPAVRGLQMDFLRLADCAYPDQY